MIVPYVALLLSATAAETISIAPKEDGRMVAVAVKLEAPDVVELTRSSQDGRISQKSGETRLQFSLVGDDGKLGLPIFGRYELKDNSLVFTPRYRLAFGQRYQAVFKGDATKAVSYDVPKRKPGVRTAVDRIYPTSSALPANHLKFYIHFSQPMREGKHVFEHFTLVGEDGKPVSDPWRRTELWSADARRLTLWIHPGRVKTGVNLREQLGPVLQPGKSYRLVVSAKLRDHNGRPLASSFSKRFTTVAADHRRPLPRHWKLEPPAAETREPLVLRFGEPLDRPLLDRFVKVVDQRGKSVVGSVTVADNEQTWSFQPRQPWSASTYEVRVSGLLEDLAGNTPLHSL